MGAIWLSGAELIGGLADLVGYKLGLAVTEQELHEVFVRAGLGGEWPEDIDAMQRHRSEELEAIALAVLARLGDPDAAVAGIPPVLGVLRELPEETHPLAHAVIGDTITGLGPCSTTEPPMRAWILARCSRLLKSDTDRRAPSSPFVCSNE